MYNRIIFILISMLMIGTIASAQQKSFTITGNIKDKTDGYIYISYQSINTRVMDSSRIVNGRFSFKGNLDGPTQAAFMNSLHPRSSNEYVQLFIMPGNLQLTLDDNNLSDGVLKGSPVQDEADKLKRLEAPIMAKIKPLSEAYSKANEIYRSAIKEKKDEATLEKLKDEAEKAKDAMSPYQNQLRQIDKEYMDTHPSTYITANILRYSLSGMPLQEGELRYAKLSHEVKNTTLGKEIEKDLDGLKSGSPGAKAYVFSSTELRGEPLSLADYKGKYVLLDFWASWCVPCRAGNPHLLKLYSKYKNEGKGLEIIGIADDDNNPNAWKKAVEKDGIGVWKHVLRGLKTLPNYQFDRSKSIADKYGINSLPTKILIDPNGIIIGRYGGDGENEEAMDKKLAEIFGS